MADNPKNGVNKTKRLTAKQKKLALLLVDVEAGRMTLTDAILQAGYSPETARQQQNAVGSLRNNEKIQAALRKAGVTEDVLAEKIAEGLDATEGKLDKPDFNVRHKYVATGAELLDAFPSKKLAVTMNPVGYGELEEPEKAESPEKARKMAGD